MIARSRTTVTRRFADYSASGETARLAYYSRKKYAMTASTEDFEFPVELTGAVVDEFSQKGFVVTPGVLSSAELDRYQAAVDDEVALRTAGDDRSIADKTRYEQSFVQCMRLWETNDLVRELTCHPALAGVAAQLLCVDSVRLWQDQALFKEAGGEETTAHQDLTFWPLGEEPLISAWIPFDDVTVSNGAMSYVPGSHQVGRLKVVDITHSSEPYDILNDPALNGAQPELVEVSAGSIVWHHGLTVHQAGANLTAATRRVFTIVYIAGDARRIKGWYAYPLDRAGVAEGELIQGEGMPVLWPPPDSLPEPPGNLGRAVGPQ
jgi:ectoine hydroxylase-related dioxygenase (phytanoyl-CoA dioxygenase family)